MFQTSTLMATIQGHMTDKGMTQRDVANKMGVCQSHVSNLLSSKIRDPQISTVMKLCDAVGVKVRFTVPPAVNK